jgi:hypothetical protein
MSRYIDSPIVMGWILPKGLVMAKRRAMPRIGVIWGGMWPFAIWKQSWNNWGNPLVEFLKCKQSRKCSKPSQKDQLPIDGACVGILVWRN